MGTTLFLYGPWLAPRRCGCCIIWFSSSFERPLWVCDLLLRVSCSCDVRGAGCDDGVCTGVNAELEEKPSMSIFFEQNVSVLDTK